MSTDTSDFTEPSQFGETTTSATTFEAALKTETMKAEALNTNMELKTETPNTDAALNNEADTDAVMDTEAAPNTDAAMTNCDTSSNTDIDSASSKAFIAGAGIDASASSATWVWVAMDDIDPGFCPASSVRETASKETIRNYTEHFDALPAIILVYDEMMKRHWVADGRHRLEAARDLDRDEVQAVVTTGTYLDAFKAACHANDAHGLPTTKGDKKHRVEVALAHPEMGTWSQGKIAELCGVTQQYVGKIKQESETAYTTGCISGSESESSRCKPGRRPRSGVRAPVTPPVEDVAPLPEPEDTPPDDDDDAVKAGHPEGFSRHPARQGTGPDVAPVPVVDGDGEVVRHPLVDAWADMYFIYIKDIAPAIARARGDRRSVPEIDLDTTLRMEGQVEEVRDALNWLKIDWIELMKGRRREIGFDGLANFHEPQRTHQ